MSGQVQRVLVVDAVGYDRRLVNATDTPFTHRLFERYPHQVMDGQPTTEVWPALVTGVHPGERGHTIWHAKMRDKAEDGPLGRLINKLPDWLVTTCQLFPHLLFRHGFDVPAMPRWRRHQLEFHRLKYNLRWQNPADYHVVGGAKTMFGAMGEESYYRVAGKFEELDAMAELFPTEHRLQMFELHAFDLVQHWYLDQPDVIAEHLKLVDRCLETIHDKCKAEGVTFVLLIEHGQERVLKENHINLQKIARETGVKREEMCYYNGVAVARFWFKTDHARRKITAAVERTPHLKVMTWREMNERFEMTLTPAWGELYVICEPGHLFHPQDYYHPLGNLFVGLTQKTMRKRMFDPYHRGYHGQVPGYPSENAYALVADEHIQPTRDKARLMDFAPSMLHLLGVPTPDYMAGHPAFDFVEPKGAAAPRAVVENVRT